MFVDTPGIHRPLHRMNVRMVDAAVETLREVDVVVLVFDASTRPGHGDEFVSELLKDVTMPVVLVLNKVDLVAKTAAAAAHRTGAALARVRRDRPGLGGDRRRRAGARAAAAVARCPRAEPLYPDDYLTDQPERVLVAETVREKVLQHTRAELPFSTAVVVDQFDESERERDPAALLHDLRRDRVAEADRHRPRRRDDQADRHRCAQGLEAFFEHARCSSTCASR